jgi:hypothetical protein
MMHLGNEAKQSKILRKEKNNDIIKLIELYGVYIFIFLNIVKARFYID